MKSIILIVCLAFFITSCGVSDGADPFSALHGAGVITVESVKDNTVCSFTYDRGAGRVEFLTPTEIEGIVMERAGDGAVLKHGAVSVPLSEYTASLLTVCDTVFGAHLGDVVSITATEREGAMLTSVVTENAEYLFSADGAVMSVKGRVDGYDFHFNVKALVCAQ